MLIIFNIHRTKLIIMKDFIQNSSKRHENAYAVYQKKDSVLYITFKNQTALTYDAAEEIVQDRDRKSTRLNSSHVKISYAVFCLKKKKKKNKKKKKKLLISPTEQLGNRWLYV